MNKLLIIGFLGSSLISFGIGFLGSSLTSFSPVAHATDCTLDTSVPAGMRANKAAAIMESSAATYAICVTKSYEDPLHPSAEYKESEPLSAITNFNFAVDKLIQVHYNEPEIVLALVTGKDPWFHVVEKPFVTK
ncbi:MAG: hypothetical protein PF495_13445 [Spirochaetales bacterium]|jgi:hypothetical protein|nr:hypothetical protein [Spirochaetales bacterium]